MKYLYLPASIFCFFFGQMLKMIREHCKKLMQVSIDSEINSLDPQKSKYIADYIYTCIFTCYHLPNIGAVGSEVLVLVSVEELSFGLCFFTCILLSLITFFFIYAKQYCMKRLSFECWLLFLTFTEITILSCSLLT